MSTLMAGCALSGLGAFIVTITALFVDPWVNPIEGFFLLYAGGLLTMALPAAITLGFCQLVRRAFSP